MYIEMQRHRCLSDTPRPPRYAASVRLAIFDMALHRFDTDMAGPNFSSPCAVACDNTHRRNVRTLPVGVLGGWHS